MSTRRLMLSDLCWRRVMLPGPPALFVMVVRVAVLIDVAITCVGSLLLGERPDPPGPCLLALRPDVHCTLHCVDLLLVTSIDEM